MSRIFAADAKAGEVVLVGTKPVIVTSAYTYSAGQPLATVETRGMWDIPQKAETIAGGDAVYWDPTGNPYGGTLGSGAATAVATAYPLGRAAAVQTNGTATTAATDTYVRVLVENFVVATTVAGAVTADSIVGSDSTLTIVGLSAATGGLVSVTGALGSAGAGGSASLVGGAGTAGAGGAAVVTGGAGNGANAGGAVTITGGAGGAAGAGGAFTLAGGVPASGNAAGGAGSIAGGAGSGTGAGGAVTVAGGVGGATGAGGSVSLTGAAGGATSGNGGAVNLTGGAGTAGNGNGGSLVFTPGALHGSGVNGMIRHVGRVASRVTVTAETNAVTLTIAKLLTGIITGTHATGSTAAYTLPTGTLCSAGCACADGDGFEWSLINESANAADSITVTAGDDHTIVGNAIVISKHVNTGGAITSMGVASSRWYTRKTTGNTWVSYRIG